MSHFLYIFLVKNDVNCTIDAHICGDIFFVTLFIYFLVKNDANRTIDAHIYTHIYGVNSRESHYRGHYMYYIYDFERRCHLFP